MATVDKLFKYLNSKNVADLLDEDKCADIARDVVVGYEIDDDSRKKWLDTNKEAIKLIKNSEKEIDDPEKEFPFYKASKVVYPLLEPASNQLASRLIQHVVRNNRVAECAVLGEDPDGAKEAKAKRVSDFLSYELLLESDDWLLHQHKLCKILASWGMAFKEVYYDTVTKKPCSELIPPEDVIINHNTVSLDKCRRISLRQYLTKNNIIEKVRAEEFCDLDLECLNTTVMENEFYANDSRETRPVYEFVKQYCWIDLDDDDYEEPYIAWVHISSKKLFGLYPAFELEDLKVSGKGEVDAIIPRNYIVDYHLMDDPEGKFYSFGLNHTLLHLNKSITSTLRQLHDAGTLANQQGGFVTKLFKTKERNLRVKFGEFKVLESMPGVDLRTQIMPLPFKEPSQVLLQLLEVLIQAGKETGFMTDVLTGDVQGQNMPATTMLAMVEQASRPFPPIVHKLFMAEKREFKLWFHFHAKYLDQKKYFTFEDSQQAIAQSDFDENSLDIMPVADPSMSSEAHKYARSQAWLQAMQIPAIQQNSNMQEGLLRFYKTLEYANPEKMVATPQPAQPDPTKMAELQAQAQLKQKDFEIDQLKQMIAAQKVQNEGRKTDIKQQEVAIKAHESKAKIGKMIVDAHQDAVNVQNQREMTDIERFNAETERQRIGVLEKQSRNKTNS